MALVQNIGIEMLSKLSEEKQEEINQIFQQIVYNYFFLFNGDSNQLGCNLVNQYTRNYKYLLDKYSEIKDLILYFNEFFDGSLNITSKECKELRQRLKQLYGCVMNRIFPDHFVTFSRYKKKFESDLVALSTQLQFLRLFNA